MSADVTVNVMDVPVRAVVAAAVKLTVGGASGRDAETVVACDSEPLVPVMVTVYVAGVVELNVRVDVDTEPLLSVTLMGLSEAVTPDGVDVTERDGPGEIVEALDNNGRSGLHSFRQGHAGGV